MHEIIARALDEMQLLALQIENRLETLMRVLGALFLKKVGKIRDFVDTTLIAHKPLP